MVVKIEGMWVILHFPAGNSHHTIFFFFYFYQEVVANIQNLHHNLTL
jgi:hypothetical protein